jgi:CheY-like chemotaxis protein
VKPQKFVLYADDDIDDKDWVSEAGKAVDGSLQLVFVENGRQVLEYLSQRDYGAVSFPYCAGPEHARTGRPANPAAAETASDYKTIPVVIVTTSTNKLDRDVCHNLGAALFLTKPDKHTEWQNVIRHLVPYVA